MSCAYVTSAQRLTLDTLRYIGPGHCNLGNYSGSAAPKTAIECEDRRTGLSGSKKHSPIHETQATAVLAIEAIPCLSMRSLIDPRDRDDVHHIVECPDRIESYSPTQ